MASVMIPMIRYIQKTLKVITEDQNGWHVQTREAGQDPGAGRPRHRSGAEPGDRRPARSQERPGAEPGDRNPEAVRRFIERFATVLGEAGFPQTPARVFVALMTSDDGLLTAAELGGILRASPATVSGGVRYLIQVGLVSRESEPGSRRHRYRIPGDVWYAVMRSRDKMFTRWADVMREGAAILGPGSPAANRMAESVAYFEFLDEELPKLFTRWLERRAGAG